MLGRIVEMATAYFATERRVNELRGLLPPPPQNPFGMKL
jgi:hypothetical protein